MASTMCGLRAPGHVYSAILKNSSEQDVTVEVEYAGSDSSHLETVNVDVAKGASQNIEEKSVSTGDYEQRKFIQKLTVKLQDGSTTELAAPFAGVASPKQNWEFEIGQDGSLKSGSQ
jgi:hypothetical protein